MMNIHLSPQKKGGLNVLCLGAHCDDIEIGCGGTLLKLINKYEVSQVRWVVFSSNELRREEAQSSAQQFLETVKQVEIEILDYKDGYLPATWSSVKDEFEKIKEKYSPDLIFTHYRDDLHQDHRLINELTWNTFRNHLVLEYEIPKYDGDLGNPNLFVPLEERHINRKKEILMNSFKSQMTKHWFDDSLFSAVMRMRGVESASPSNYAEAFYNRKMVL